MEQQQSSQQSVSSSDDTAKDAEQLDQSAQPTQNARNLDRAKQPSKVKQLWAKLGLDTLTFMLMLKGSIPPTIAIAMYQSSAVAKQYSTLGYLVAIMSILSFAIMPRGKFLQTMSLNIIAACLAAAVNLLALFCVTQARLHTTVPRGLPLQGYNSSASAVCAIWLIVQIYLVNVVRAARPQFHFPAIIYSIFVSVSLTYGVEFPNMTSAIAFIEPLLKAFLTGFALATGTNLFIFPVSERKVVFKEMTGHLMCLSGMLKAQTVYMRSVETIDPVGLRQGREEAEGDEKSKKAKHFKKTASSPSPLATPASSKLKELLGKTIELHTKLHGNITPAKREFAWGKLSFHDLTELWRLLRMVFVPIIGLSTSMDLVQRLASELHWAREGPTDQKEKVRKANIDNLHFLMKQLHGPFARMTARIDTAIMHVLITLELVKPLNKKPDEESKGDQPVPGTPAFAEVYRKQVDDYYHSKKITLSEWCKEHDIPLSDDFFGSTFLKPEQFLIRNEHKREKYQRQLFFTLYLEYLLWRASSAVLDLVLWADKRKQDGALERNKLIFPGSRTLSKWLKSVFSEDDLSNDGHYMAEMDSGGSKAVYLGEDFARRKDPEHLPPCNARERVGEISTKRKCIQHLMFG